MEVALSFQKELLNNAGAMIIATEENGISKLFNRKAVSKIRYQAVM